jgi:hypothetical protein
MLNFKKTVHPVVIILILLLPTQPGLAGQSPLLASSVSLSPGDIGWKAGFSTNGLDDSARAITTDGKNIYVVGRFTVAGDVVVNGVAMWNGSAWQSLGKEIFNTYSALAVDGRGNLYVAGKFSQKYVNPDTTIARWNGQVWETVGKMANGIINALAIDSAGDVYAGGQFSSVDGVEASGIAMWDGVRWHSLTGGVSGVISNGIVNAITIDRFGFVYVGGWFSSAGGKSFNNIARWDGKEWSALGEGIAARDSSTGVYALAADYRGNLYAGGTFTMAGGVTALNVARWNGESWSALGAGVTVGVPGFQVVQSILVDGGMVYIAGAFKSVGNIPVNGIARWNGAAWENINDGKWGDLYLPNGESFVYLRSLAMDRDGRLYAAGNFRMAGGRSANDVAVWDGSDWSGLGTDASVETAIRQLILDPKGGLYVAGNFLSAGGIIVNHIAHWSGSTWTGLGGGVTGLYGGSVTCLALDDAGNLYAAGSFTQAGNIPASNVAKWNGSIWESLGSGVNGDVASMAVDSQNHLYVSGWFSTAGGVPVNNIAEWTGTQWEALGDGLNGMPAYALVVDAQDRLIAGGSFDIAGGIQADGLARWDGQMWESINDGVQRWITSLSLKGDTLNIGGRNQIWKLVDGTFEKVGDPIYYFINGTYYDTSPVAIVFDNHGRMIVGGFFTKAGNVTANNIARWNGIRWESLGSGTNSSVNSMVLDDGGNLVVGGGFSQAGGKVSHNLAIWIEPTYIWLPFVSE